MFPPARGDARVHARAPRGGFCWIQIIFAKNHYNFSFIIFGYYIISDFSSSRINTYFSEASGA